MSYYIDANACLGCGACRFACLFHIPKPDATKEKYTISATACRGCGQCEDICPNGAIHPKDDHRQLVRVTVDTAACTGCHKCATVCLANAAVGVKNEPHRILQEKCFHCGMCAHVCRDGAIRTEYK